MECSKTFLLSIDFLLFYLWFASYVEAMIISIVVQISFRSTQFNCFIDFSVNNYLTNVFKDYITHMTSSIANFFCLSLFVFGRILS